MFFFFRFLQFQQQSLFPTHPQSEPHSHCTCHAINSGRPGLKSPVVWSGRRLVLRWGSQIFIKLKNHEWVHIKVFIALQVCVFSQLGRSGRNGGWSCESQARLPEPLPQPHKRTGPLAFPLRPYTGGWRTEVWYSWRGTYAKPVGTHRGALSGWKTPVTDDRD